MQGQRDERSLLFAADRKIVLKPLYHSSNAFSSGKKVLKSRHNSNPKVVLVDVTYNQLFAVLRRPCLSLRKEQNKLKMRLFWNNVRKLKGETEKYLFLTDSLWTYQIFVISFVLTKQKGVTR